MPRGFQLGCMRIIAEISLFNHWYKIVNLKAVEPPPRLYRTMLMDNRLQCSIELLSCSRCLFASQTSDRYPFIDNLCYARIIRWGKELCSKHFVVSGKQTRFLNIYISWKFCDISDVENWKKLQICI